MQIGLRAMRCAILGMWLGCSGVLLANESLPWEKEAFAATPQELLEAVKNLPVDENVGAMVMLEARYYRIKADGGVDFTQRWMYVIQNADAVESWSNTETSWAPWYETRPEIRVRVVNTDGSEVWLAEENIVEVASEANSNIYTDRRRLAAPFPQVQVGSVIEEVIFIKGERAFFEGGTNTIWLGQGGVDQLRRALIVDVEEGATFQFKVLEMELEPKVEKHGDVTRYSFLRNEVPARESTESSLPFNFAAWPMVEFSTGKSWNAMALAYLQMTQEALQDETFEWVDPQWEVEGKPFETAVKLVHWLNSKVRYTGWELGESALRPTSPKLCLERGYGDCKDKALLVVGMLRKLGYSADVALLRSGTDYDVNPNLPGMGRFNHAIVAIQNGGETYWIDPTDEFSREGGLHFSNQGRWALIARSDTKELVKIPETNAAKNIAEEVRIYSFVGEKGGKVQETTTYRGQFESSMRISYQGYNDEQLAERLENYATNSYRNATVSSATKTVSEELTQPFQIKLELEQVGRAIVEDFEAVVAVMFGDPLEYLPDALTEEKEEETTRKHPFVFPYAHSYTIRYQIDPPAGFEWKADPKEETIPLGSGSYSYKVWGDEAGRVWADLQFNSGPRQISAETFTQYRQDVKKFKESPSLLLRFAHKGIILKEKGKVTESMAVFRQLATENEKDAAHLRHYVNALLEAGLIERALEVARDVCVLEPESAEALYELGNLLQLDPLGRRRHKGFDREGAIQAYLQALALDPLHQLARADLAILYEYDSEGTRYSASADLDKALEHYLYIRENFQGLDLDANIRANLVASRSFEKLREEGTRVKEKSLKEAYETLALIDKAGLKAGTDYVESLADTATRQETAAILAELLMKYRDYEGVSAFLRIAAKGSPNAREFEGRAQLLGLIKAFDPETIRQSQKPEDVVKLTIYAIVDLQGKGVDGLKEFFAEEYFKAVQDDEVYELGNLREIFLAGSRTSEISIEVFVDIILNLAKLTTEGDEATGYRVELRLEGGAENSLHHLFLAPRDGKLKVVADDEEEFLIAKQAFSHLLKGNLESGKKWLEWYIAAIGGPSMKPNSLAPSLRQIWNVGDPVNEQRMKLMAAAAILQESYDSTGYDFLRETMQSLDGKALEAVEIALAYGDIGREAYTKAVPVFDKLLQKYPTDTNLLVNLGTCVTYTDQWSEFDAAYAAIMSQGSRDDQILAMITKAETLMTQGKHRAAIDAYLEVSEKMDGNRLVYNQLAWLSLFVEGYEDKTQEWIEKAVGGQGGTYAELHTLATIYAEQGRCLEAKTTILGAIEAENLSEIKPGDWYVWGRMAEHYGEMELAKTYYGRVKGEPPKTEKVSSQRLAEMRLAKMTANP